MTAIHCYNHHSEKYSKFTNLRDFLYYLNQMDVINETYSTSKKRLSKFVNDDWKP